MTQKFDPVYNLSTEKAISGEFRRLEGKCYLDHAGATLYSEAQLGDVLGDLRENVYGNPHARNTASKTSEDSVDQMRYRILEHFNTTSDEYSVIFTTGATAALKLVAECFDYKHGGLVYLQDNHTSVLGMRELAPESRALCFEAAQETLTTSRFETFPEPEGPECKDPPTPKEKRSIPVFQNDCKGLSSQERRNCEESANKLVSTNENCGEIQEETQQRQKNSLFVYPAQCNFSGYKYPLDWIRRVQTGALGDETDTNWFCLLDAASFTATNGLDLSKYQPDFLCLSFYKLFGYPTGLGALLVSKRGEEALKRKYFGGGTVFLAMSGRNRVVRRKSLHERFEDGTLPFLSIISLQQGFETLKRLNLSMELIASHTFNLAEYVYRNLRELHHSNGEPACVLYHDTEFESPLDQGAIVNFNLVRADGTHIGYSEVMHISNLYGIYLRTGCFCNPGACQRHLGLSEEDVRHHFEMGHVCGDQNDLIEGVPTGSVRISFGYMSTLQDANEFLDMIVACFVTPPVIRKSRDLKLDFKVNSVKSRITNEITINEGSTRKISSGRINEKNPRVIPRESDKLIDGSNVNLSGTLTGIFLYPIKSCGAFSPRDEWRLCRTGLKYDREWMIVDRAGVCLTQKNRAEMCRIRPVIDLNGQEMILTCEGFPKISVPLTVEMYQSTKAASPCKSKVCRDEISGWDCGDEVARWLDEVLVANGLRLLRQCADLSSRSSRKEDKSHLSLANKAQYLMLNAGSLRWLHGRAPFEDVDRLAARFRCNFIVDLKQPLVENDCETFTIGSTTFTNEGQCTRCQMICINQTTGEKTVEPLKTISREFGGKISFGVYLGCALDGKQRIRIGMKATTR